MSKNIEVRKILEELDCNPIEVLVGLIRDPQTEPSLVYQASKELLQYIAPKRRAVDLETSISGQINVVISRFSDTAESPPLSVDLKQSIDSETLLIEPLSVDDEPDTTSK